MGFLFLPGESVELAKPERLRCNSLPDFYRFATKLSAINRVGRFKMPGSVREPRKGRQASAFALTAAQKNAVNPKFDFQKSFC